MPEMSVVRREIDAPPSAVREVLSDGWLYASWVVGASRVRAVDTAWPAVDSSIHHSVGVWPALIDDRTTVTHFDPAGRLTLHARGWPAGAATVDMRWRDIGADRTLVTIAEDAVAGPALMLPSPLRHAMLHPRNVETLKRLALLAEGRRRHLSEAVRPAVDTS